MERAWSEQRLDFGKDTQRIDAEASSSVEREYAKRAIYFHCFHRSSKSSNSWAAAAMVV